MAKSKKQNVGDGCQKNFLRRQNFGGSLKGRKIFAGPSFFGFVSELEIFLEETVFRFFLLFAFLLRAITLRFEQLEQIFLPNLPRKQSLKNIRSNEANLLQNQPIEMVQIVTWLKRLHLIGQFWSRVATLL